MAKQCPYCGVTDEIIPVTFIGEVCKRCVRIQCFQLIRDGLFQEMIEKDIQHAECMLQVAKEFKERNPYEYQKITEKVRQDFEEYMNLLLWC